jgi:hypothetical protein
MKSFLTSRSDLTWVLLAIPTMIVAHWMIVSAAPWFLHLVVPDAVRTIVHLL